jgi:hypothetical protein
MTDKSDDPPPAFEDGIKTGGMTGPNVAVDEQPLAPVDWRETLPAAEFCCWVVVFLAPLLRWINGKAVTDDQAAIQATLFSTALLTAIGLRVFNRRRRNNVNR